MIGDIILLRVLSKAHGWIESIGFESEYGE